MNLNIVRIDELEDSSLLDQFYSTHQGIDNYLKEKALIDYQQGITTTHVVFNEDVGDIIGFFSLRCSALLFFKRQDAPTGQPALELYMFAIDKKYQGVYIDQIECKVSDLVLIQVIEMCIAISEMASAQYIIANALNEGHVLNMYRRNNFIDLNIVFSYLPPLTDIYGASPCVPMVLELP